MATTAVWESATIFCTDPVATGRFYAALGLPVRVVDSGLAEVPMPSGPALRLVEAQVPSRTYIGVRVGDFSAVERGLSELGAWWERRHPNFLVCRDPDGNGVYALLPRLESPPQRLIIWKVYVTDVNDTMRWFRHGLDLSTSDVENRIVVVGNSPTGATDDVWVNFRDPPSLLLFPAGGGRVTEAALNIRVPALHAVADRLEAMQWEYEFKGPMALVTETPDGWPIHVVPLPKEPS